MPISRRVLLAGAAAAACRKKVDLPELPEETLCGVELPRGDFLGLLPFFGEGDLVLEERTGLGLDARYYVDLATVSPSAEIIEAERFYLRTGAPEGLVDPADWVIALEGLVQQAREISLDELLMQVESMGILHFECSGNGDKGHFGLMSAGDFDGVPMAWLLSQVTALPEAAFIEVIGHDEHAPSTFSTEGASWVLHASDLADAWLVTHQDGVPLLPDHGGPVRLLIPGWFGCCNIKWVERLRWLPEDAQASTQMVEFAQRTHQVGVPAFARDYAPAEIETAATVIRVEEWVVDGERLLRVIGLVWGGKAPPSELHLWMDEVDLGPVELCERPDTGTWGLWQGVLPSDASGIVTLRCTATGVPARRLDSRWYDRQVNLGS